MLEKQIEQEERKALIGVYAPRSPGLTEEQRSALEWKIEEAKRTSTLMDHVEQPPPGRHAQPQTVVGQSGRDPWPKIPGYWAWADMQQSPTFGQQLTEFGVSQTAVQTERKR
jgi:hypothetical protein